MSEGTTPRATPLAAGPYQPQPGIGWHHKERASLLERGPADTTLALALIHHLAITNNLPFVHVAAFLAETCTWLIIEFVPKSDSQVQRLLASREDIFDDYVQEKFETAFQEYFAILDSTSIRSTERTLYLMQRLEARGT